MVPYFPFVVFPCNSAVVKLHSERPCASLAALAAASFEERHIQKGLNSLFDQVVAARMLDDDVFNSLDLLQGLLIHLAW